MRDLIYIFNIYSRQSKIIALWTVLRFLLLPYKKINMLVPDNGVIIDIGCGRGGFTHFLAYRSSKRGLLGIDLSKKRISIALKSIESKKNIQFLFGDVITVKLPKANCYLIIDVLHHIDFHNQKKLLNFLTKRLGNDSVLIIKEIDPSNKIPFLFGHIFEKFLYPKEKIYARSKGEWKDIFRSLNLSIKVYPGVSYFPDSTKIYVLKKTKK